MNMTRLCTALAIGLFATLSARAEVTLSDNGAASGVEAISSDLADFFAIADDFVLSPPFGQVTQVNWWGTYDEATPTAQDNFTIQIFGNDDSGGEGADDVQPLSTPLLEFNVGHVARTATGATTNYGGDPIYAYSASVNLGSLGGDRHWLSVINDTSPDTERDWAWMVSSLDEEGANAIHRQPPDYEWSRRFFDSAPEMAFNLVGTLPPPVFSIVEEFDAGANSGEFTVNNFTADEIHAFMVENTHEGPFPLEAFTDGEAGERNWAGAIVTRAEWEAATDFADLVPYIFGWDGPDLVDWETGLGFSPGSSAFVYWVADTEGGWPIFGGDVVDGFMFGAPEPESLFAAFGADGGLLEVGQTIPEPATTLMLLGGGLLALVRRRAA